MPPSGWEQVRRLLAIRLDNVGDVIMLGPAVRALRRALPEAHLTLMASPAGSEAAALLPHVDDVLTARVAWQDASWSMPVDPEREHRLIAKVRARRFDAAVIFTSFSQSPYPPAYACYLAGIPIRLGQSKEFGGSLLSQWVRPGPDCTHQVDRNLALLTAAGFESAGRHLDAHVDGRAASEADALLRDAGLDPLAPFGVAAPTASCAARTYPLDRFAEVLGALPVRTGLPFVVVGSPRDRAVLEPMARGIRGVVSLAGRTSVPQLAGVVRRAAFALVNNSAPMHLADAFGRPMVVLYSGSEYEEQWRPRFAPARLLRRETPCSPCYRFTCPYDMECLAIAPRDVVAACVDLLRETSTSAAARPGVATSGAASGERARA